MLAPDGTKKSLMQIASRLVDSQAGSTEFMVVVRINDFFTKNLALIFYES